MYGCCGEANSCRVGACSTIRPAYITAMSSAVWRGTASGTVPSGIRKRTRDGAVQVQTLGLAGDEQADPSVHGGISKALYAYPSEHYAFWQTLRAQAGAAAWGEKLAPGALGENLTLSGLLEENAFIGDVLRFPHCELAISEPRYPCFKFNAVMGFAQAAKLRKEAVDLLASFEKCTSAGLSYRSLHADALLRWR